MRRDDEAITHSRRSLAINPNYVNAHIVLGDVLRMQGNYDDAIASYRHVIARVPTHGTTHAKLAVTLTERGHYDEPRRHFERAVALEPNDSRIHFSYGNFCLEQGDMARAIECYLRAMELNPGSTDAHCGFCAALMALSKYDAVAEYYEKFLAIKPDFVEGYNHLASAYAAAGNAPKAIETIRRGLAIEETQQGKAIFAQSLQTLTNAPDQTLRDLVVRAVSEPWIRPILLARQCVAMIKANPEIATCMSRAAAAWPALPSAEQLFGASGLAAVAGDKLLRAYLEGSRVTSIEMETFVTAARSALLEMAATDRTEVKRDDPILAFACALARQCFITEYVLSQTPRETAEVNALRASLDSALRANTDVSPFQLAVIAAYVPLHTLNEHDQLLGRPWPQAIDAMLVQQIREPSEERALRDHIPALTAIEDRVSVAVRNQYEENPFPRWIDAPPAEQPVSIRSYLRANFPLVNIQPLNTSGTVDMLIAGCGTGQSVVDYATRFVSARVLAVDLSLTSLAYAKRKAQALGLANVEFAQADILKLGSLGRAFDLINCGGVLHHLGDPEQGWRILLSLLKPNGFMNVALYSETARRDYVAAQRLITERGYGHSPDEIRRFRQDLIAAAPSPMRNRIVGCPDFYSVSECRDLLFHVQEHRMTIPRLKAFFEQNSVRFIGFDLDRPVRQLYLKRFPDDAALTNLDNWHIFEQENPYTFASMYQIWLQSGGSAA